jgi:hypothetical protein
MASDTALSERTQIPFPLKSIKDNSVSYSSSKGTAFITGASRGIGAVYADHLAKRGYDLMPGGSLIALLLWLCNHRPARA